MEDWIVVLDSNDASQEQLRVCRALRPPLRGAVQCDDPDNAEAAVCRAVEAFPSFCHAPSNACVQGLRATQADLEALTALAP